jgi:hypothetical protein
MYDPNSQENALRRSSRTSTVQATRAVQSDQNQQSIAEDDLPDDNPAETDTTDEGAEPQVLEDTTEDTRTQETTKTTRLRNGLESPTDYPFGGSRSIYPRRIIPIEKQYAPFNRDADKDNNDAPAWEDLLTEDGETDNKVLAICRTQILDEAKLQASHPSVRPISSADFYDLKIRQDSVESAYAAQITSISETLMALAKVWGPSTETGALLHAHDQLKILTLALSVPYSERDSFLLKNGSQTSLFKASLMKDISAIRKSARRSSMRRKSNTIPTINYYPRSQQSSQRQDYGRQPNTFKPYRPFRTQPPPSSSNPSSQ